jgi:large subunit ribosomal protein L23
MSDGATVVHRLAYEREKSKGELLVRDKAHLTPLGWLEEKNAKRNRIRGRHSVSSVSREKTASSDAGDSTTASSPASSHSPTASVTEPLLDRGEDSKSITSIDGRPVYFPDFVLRLIPNYTPPGEPYNPWQATFYVPHSLTKLDIRSYLHSVYGLDVTYIRTDNYYAPIKRQIGAPHRRSTDGIAMKSRKRAVVGLKQPFIFPNMREEMMDEERAEQTRELDGTVKLTATVENDKRVVRHMMGVLPDPWSGRVMGKKNIMRERKNIRDHAETRIKESVEKMIQRAIKEGTHGITTVKEDQIPLP